MPGWWLAAVAAAGGWSGTLAGDVIEAVQAQRPPSSGARVGLVLRGPVNQRTARLELQQVLGPHRLVPMDDLKPQALEQARVRGIEIVVELSFAPQTVTAHLWLIDGGVWTHTADDPPTLLRRLEVDRRSAPEADRPSPLAAARDGPKPASGPRLSKERLFAVSHPVRAVTACDRALILLADDAVHAYVPAAPGAWHPVDPLPLAVLRTRDIRSRAPVGALSCWSGDDGAFRIAVGHGSFERSGAAELDVARRSLNWSRFLNGIPLAAGPDELVFGSLEPGTHRFEPTVFRTRGGATTSFELPSFLEVRFVSEEQGGWWLVDPELQVHHGNTSLDLRVGRGLVPYAGGIAASSATPGPEAFIVYDRQGRERARASLPGPVTAASPWPSPSGGTAALVAVSVDDETEIYRIDLGASP